MLDTVSRVSDEAKVEALEPETQEAEEPEEPEAPARPTTTGSPAIGLLFGRVGALLLSSPQHPIFRKGLPIVWVAAAAVAGLVWGAPLLLLILAAGALALVVVLMWSSVQSLTGGAALGFEEALGMGAPSRVEEEKRAVLRALKDLEYERGVGKISPEDYAELSARYRAEAKRLMQSLDAKLGPAREEVERAIQERLARLGVSPPDAKLAEKPADLPQNAAEKLS
jgi:hypothetical protein